jgi:anthranilate synthase component II
MKILLIDNYDSFTWNLVHYLEQMVDEVVVLRNDDPGCLEPAGYDGVVISPGPGLPCEAAFTLDAIGLASGRIPLLGVCLGLQAIVVYFGGSLCNLPEVLHGRQCTSFVAQPDVPLFQEVPRVFKTGHYHSWVADPQCLPDELIITATDEFGNIMAIAHRDLPVMAVQFHPESVLTPDGMRMISNWVQVIRNRKTHA